MSVNFSFFIHLSDLLLGKTHKSILLRETFFFLHVWGGGGGQEQRFSNVSNNRFFNREITGKTLPAWKNVIGNITLSQTSGLNLDKFGVGNYIPDC